jgi:transcriptional regulator with XRE-family HTH domain
VNAKPKPRAKPRRREPTLETAQNFGERVRAAYLTRGMNRSELMRALGVAYTTILAWEEMVTPDLEAENLHALSVVTGVSTSYLLGEDEPVTESEHEEWARFLSTELGRGMSQSERTILGSTRYTSDEPPSVERYAAVLFAIRGTAKKAS